MPSKQTLNIRILSCGGMFDLMSEQEATFLNSSLGLFRNVQDLGRAVPRANASRNRALLAPSRGRNAERHQTDGPGDVRTGIDDHRLTIPQR